MMSPGNTSPLSRLYGQIEDSLLSTATQGFLNKVEINGAPVLAYELVLGEQKLWYRWENGTSHQLNINDDKKLPLASWLAEQTDSSEITVLSYRPHKRLTLLDNRASKPRVIKGFRPKTIKTMIRQYEHARDALAGTSVRAPEIIEHDGELASLVMAYEEGDRLSLDHADTEVFHDIGHAIATLQNSSPRFAVNEHSSADEMAVIKKRMSRMHEAGISLPDGFNELFKRIETVLPDLPAAEMGLCHRDLHDKQFISHPHYLTLLDFDLMCKADKALDPGNFLAHLVLRQLQGVVAATQKSVDIAGNKLLEALDHPADPDFWQRLRFYQATTFARLALVYMLRPRWSEVIPGLIRMSQRCIDDLERVRRQK